MSTSHLIVESYLATADIKQTNEIQERVSASLNRDPQAERLTPLNYHLGVLDKTNPNTFCYLNDIQKNQLLRELQVAYFFLVAQKQYEITHQKTENIKKYDVYLVLCQKLIDSLHQQMNPNNPFPPLPVSEGHPEKYLFIQYAKWLADAMVDFADRKTKTIQKAMGWFNEKRLYWVWGSSLLKTVLELLPDDFFNTSQAAGAVKSPDPYTGTLSWALYYFRFSLNLFLLLKHTLRGPWMSEEEKQMPWTERFTTQWEQRKFTLLNDSLWATANLVCFFWLNGKTGLGTWGDLLTLGLLVFDISVAAWDYAEQNTRYHKEMSNYDNDIHQLGQANEILQQVLVEKDTEQEQIEVKKALYENELKIAALKRAQTQCKTEWRHQQFGLALNISYAVGLMLAFTVLTVPFLPITGPALMAVGTIGAVLCFALTVVYSTIKSGAEVYKAYYSKKELQQELEDLIKEWMTTPPEDENMKKLLFLEIKTLEAETEHQKNKVVYQTLHFLRSLVIESLTPALIFASFVFLPLGGALGVLAAALITAIISHLVIEMAFKPKDLKPIEFDEENYSNFCNNVEKKNRTSERHPASDGRFFNQKPDQPASDNQQDEHLNIPLLPRGGQ